MSQAYQTDHIRNQLDAGSLAANVEIIVLDEVDSTNDWSLERYGQQAELPFAVFAEKQSAGKGRRGRVWSSTACSDIAMSLAVAVNLPMPDQGLLSLAIGMAVRDALAGFGVDGAELKWPNDVLVDGCKIAGILIEKVSSPAGADAYIIGVGINVGGHDAGLTARDFEWTDVSRVTGSAHVDRDALAGLLLKHCLAMCEAIIADVESVRARLVDCFDVEREVDVLLEQGEQVSGVTRGITASGEIRVLIGDEVKVFNSADISLRPQGVAN